jgi:predicted dehydrogenase
MNDPSPSRRDFLGASAVAGLALATPALHAARGANERLQVGILGPGGRGRSLLKTFFDVGKEHQAELAAVCDLWPRQRRRAADAVKQATGKEPRQFAALDELLAWKDLDAVIIATPDHAHAQHLRRCVEAGKHVYCEKPFANVLDEANAALDACRAARSVVTIGTQRRSDPRYLAAADLLRGGILGPVVRVEIVQNAYSPYRWRRDADVQLLKEGDVDWKAFLMGKTDRPFDPRQYLEFRLFKDFSSGIIDQWMTHLIDTVHLLTGAKYPRRVTAQGGTYAWKDHRENPDTVQVALDYPEGFLCTYASTLINGAGSGCRVLGRQGTLEYETAWRFSGEGVTNSKLEARAIGPKEGFRGDMDHIHMSNWLQCVGRGQKETHCTAEHGYQHAVACIMATQALWSGRRVVFDEKSRALREG